MSIDHASSISTAKRTDPVFLLVKAEMAMITMKTDGTCRVDVVVNVIGSVKDPRVPKFIQVTCVDNHVNKWVNAELVSHIVPRAWTAAMDGKLGSPCTSESWREWFVRLHHFICKQTTHREGGDYVFGVPKASINGKQWTLNTDKKAGFSSDLEKSVSVIKLKVSTRSRAEDDYLARLCNSRRPRNEVWHETNTIG